MKCVSALRERKMWNVDGNVEIHSGKFLFFHHSLMISDCCLNGFVIESIFVCHSVQAQQDLDEIEDWNRMRVTKILC